MWSAEGWGFPYNRRGFRYREGLRSVMLIFEGGKQEVNSSNKRGIDELTLKVI